MIKRISTELLKVSSAAERPGLEKEMVQWLAASKGESILIAGILAGEWKKIINFYDTPSFRRVDINTC